MKKLIKVFSLVLVLAVLCASIAAFAISSSAADAGTYTSEELTASNFVGAAALDDPATIGPSIGGNVAGNIVTDPNGNSYIEITNTHMANGAKDYAVFHTNDGGVTVDHGTPYAFVVFEYDTAGATNGGLQFLANVSWQKGTIDAEGKRTDAYGSAIQQWNWMYSAANHVDGNFTANQWYHHTLIMCVYSDGSFDGNLYHFIDGIFKGTGRNGQKMDPSHIDGDNEFVRLNKLNLGFYNAGNAYVDGQGMYIDNISVKGYVGDTETAEITALKKAIGSSKDFSAWNASAGNYGEYKLADIDAPSANVTINVNGETYTGIAPIGVSMAYAANKVAVENNVSLGGASEVTVTSLGNGRFNITDGAAWSYSSDKVVDGTNTATFTVSSPTYVVLNSDLSLQRYGFDNNFVSILTSSGDAIVVLNKDVTIDGSAAAFNNPKGTDTLYLNGNSINYSATQKFIMIEGSASPNFTIAGPGEINMNVLSANAAFMMSYSKDSAVITLKDLTLNYTSDNKAGGMMLDQRCGTFNVENCVINLSHGGSAFCPNNSFPHVTHNQPSVLNITGSTINAPYGTGDYIFNFSEYGYRVQNGAQGVHAIIANIDDTVFNCGWHNVFVINTTPESYNNGVEAVTETTVNVTGDTVVNYSRANWYGDVSRAPAFAEGVVINGLQDCTGITLANGNVFAKFVENGDVKYVVADPADCAAVTWGDSNAVEYWVAGSVPVASKDYGKYVVSEVAAGESYTFNTAPTAKFKLYMNLTLNTDFDLNVYVPAAAGVASVDYAGVTYVIGESTPVATIKGATYYVVTKAVAPAEAGLNYPVVVTLANGEILTWNVSLLDYCERVLADDVTYAAEQQLIKDAVAYIKAANAYFGVIEGAFEIDSIEIDGATSYNEAKANTDWAGEGDGKYDANVAMYFRSYTIDLTSAPKIRLYLVDGLNTDITVYVYDSMEQWENVDEGIPASTTEYTIVNGECDGKNYIELEFKAYQFNNLIYATMGTDGYLAFSAADYVNGATGNVAAVAQALYAYAYTASKYEAAKA